VPAIADEVIDELKNEIHTDPETYRIIEAKVIAACHGDQRARRWLQTDGSIWLAAVGEYLEERQAIGTNNSRLSEDGR
jgi:hypothetical protein